MILAINTLLYSPGNIQTGKSQITQSCWVLHLGTTGMNTVSEYISDLKA